MIYFLVAISHLSREIRRRLEDLFKLLGVASRSVFSLVKFLLPKAELMSG